MEGAPGFFVFAKVVVLAVLPLDLTRCSFSLLLLCRCIGLGAMFWERLSVEVSMGWKNERIVAGRFWGSLVLADAVDLPGTLSVPPFMLLLLEKNEAMDFCAFCGCDRLVAGSFSSRTNVPQLSARQ